MSALDVIENAAYLLAQCGYGKEAISVNKTHADVAELIEAAKPLLRERELMGLLNQDWKRLAAALAKVQP